MIGTLEGKRYSMLSMILKNGLVAGGVYALLALGFALVFVVFFMAFPVVFPHPYVLTILALSFLFSLLAASWDFLSGFIGQLSPGPKKIFSPSQLPEFYQNHPLPRFY
jgi:hypothetical protein